MKTALKPRKTPKQTRSQTMVDTILEATARVLSKKGYAGANTNMIAEKAGVSVGSIYQYFPNKDALIAALNRRHALQMQDVIVSVLSESKTSTLREAVRSLVRALLRAHMIEPELHRVLEREYPMNLRKGDRSLDRNISKRVQELLGEHRLEIMQPDLEMATYIILQIVKYLVHQAILESQSPFQLAEIENAISEVVLGYLILPVTEKYPAE